MTPETQLLAALERAYASHDWYFARSDDGRAYQQGKNQVRLINSLYSQAVQWGLGAEAGALRTKYTPAIK